MIEFDKKMQQEDVFFVRYADDMLVLSKDRQILREIVNKMKCLLLDLGLELNRDKTYIGDMASGFDFLGYHFDASGKSIPKKAMDKLESSLEDVWLTMVGVSLEDRLKQGSRILNGWEQYYRGEREIDNIYEYTVIVYMMRYKEELQSLVARRQEFVNQYKDIAAYLMEVWSERQWREDVLLEYEQYYGIAEKKCLISQEHYFNEILGLYEQIWQLEDEQKWADLMQAYADLDLYDRSEKVMERISYIRDNADIWCIRQ